jgi:hypothetical protein
LAATGELHEIWDLFTQIGLCFSVSGVELKGYG